MSDVTIRPAQERDFDDLTALYEEFHTFHVRGVPGWLRLPVSFADPGQHERDRAKIREQLAAIMSDPGAALLLAEAEGHIVGLGEVYLRRDEECPLTIQYTYGHLQSLMVTERWRGHGIGRQLLAAAEDWAREREATQLRLDAWEFAAGPLPFYEALGYQTTKHELVKSLP